MESRGARKLLTVPRDKADANSVAPSDDAKAVMLDFVNPSRARRRFEGAAGKAQRTARQPTAPPARLG